MTWILIDLAIALTALGVLAVLVLGLWRRVKALSATVSAAGETVGQATDALAAAQSAQPSHHAPSAPSAPAGRSAAPRGMSAAPAVHRPDAGRAPGRGGQDRAAGRSLTSSPRRGARP